MKFKNWTGEFIPKSEIVRCSLKLDGVRLHVDSGIYTSRAGKTLYNLPEGLEDGIYEVYLGNWWVGKIIEIEYQSKTPSGAYRFPRLVRVREDLL